MSGRLTGRVTCWCARGKCARCTPKKVVDPLLCHSCRDLTDEEGWKRVPAWHHEPLPVHSSDYYLLLIVQAGSDEIVQGSLRVIKRDFRGFGRLVERVGEQVVFSSIPCGMMRDMELSRKMQTLNKWLKSWCCQRNFGFFNQEAVYSAPGLMATDGSHLSLSGKQILAQKLELAGLVEREGMKGEGDKMTLTKVERVVQRFQLD